MGDSQNILREFASSRVDYFQLKDGEEKTVKFLGAEKAEIYFDSREVSCIRYLLEENGIVKVWDRTSKKLAEQMSKFMEGALITIRRCGTKNKTEYYISEVDNAPF